MLKRFLLTLILSLTLLLTGCRDELLYDPDLGEGESRVSFTVGFEPLRSALDNTRASGTAVNQINSVTVVAYHNDGTLYKVWRSKTVNDAGDGKGDFNYTTTENTGMPSDYDPTGTEHQAEQKTPKVNFTLEDIPFGRYRIYAVANLDLTDRQVASEDALQSVTVDWKEKVEDNNAMFGYFTENNTGVSPTEFTAPQITVNTPSKEITAWLKRTVSKVTIAFDGQNLNENISIYFKSAQIRDIPLNCPIGKQNEPRSKELLQKEGETIVYNTSTNYYGTYEPQVTLGSPINGALGRFPEKQKPDESLKDYYKRAIEYQHSETAPALYFFENVQEPGEDGTESDKRQDVSGNNQSVSYPDGNDSDNPANKDARPYGTYIEIKAYYVNTASDDVSQGDIIYRFMLGQDDHLDYSAYRNRHYKLTLHFNGNANDVDWHIVYDEPEIRFPRPYYISYLYNHETYVPVTIVAGDKEIEYVQCEIISNNWAPKDAADLDIWHQMDQPTKYPWNGFLTLWKPKMTAIPAPNPTNIGKNANKKYYEEHQCGIRKYTNLSPGGHTSEDSYTGIEKEDLSPDDKYYVNIKQDPEEGKIYELSIPMYTRPKNMIKETAYTGNNPFEDYYREAKVKLSVKFKGEEELVSPENMIDILQVRRLVNPKGIFRNWNDTKDFHVELSTRWAENTTVFNPITSDDGPWKAYVVGASSEDLTNNIEDAHNMITFSGGYKVVKKNSTTVSDTVYGHTGSNIDFTIKIKNKCSAKTKSRFACVRVEYNNNSCYHLIFVRQGDSSVPLVHGGVKWHTKNMVSKNKEAASPIDEGSLFKFGNWNWPIDSRSNVNNKSPWIHVDPDSFIGNNGVNLIIVGKEGRYDWTAEGFTGSSDNSFSKPGSKVGGRVSNFDDWAQLYMTKEIEQGYGVLYGNDAIDCQETYEGAFEYYTGQPTTYGMRGVFVYNSSNAVHVFFPIGNSGYGHRKESGTAWPKGANGKTVAGVLRYSCNGRWGTFPTGKLGIYPDGVDDCPLFYNIYRRPGAIYYFGKKETGINKNPKYANTPFAKDETVNETCAWDFNYFTLDFYPISPGNCGKGADAAFVRCVDP